MCKEVIYSDKRMGIRLMPNTTIAAVGGIAVTAIIVAILLSNIGVFSAIKSSMAPSDDYQAYASSTHSFSIAYPKGWNVDEGMQHLSAPHMQMLVGFFDPTNTAAVSVAKASNPDGSLIDFVEDNKAYLKSEFKDLRMVKEGGQEVNSKYGYFLEFEYVDAGASETERSKVVVFQESEKSYIVMYSAPLEYYNRSLQLFEDSLSTFKIQKDAGFFSVKFDSHDPIPELLPYIDYERGFSLNYPKGWTISHDSYADVAFTKIGAGNKIVVKTDNTDGRKNFDDYVINIKSKTNEGGDIIIKEGPADVGQFDGYYFETEQPKNNILAKAVYLTDWPSAAVVVYGSAPDSYDGQLDTFDNIITTFRFVG